jgi:phosphoribosylanthranilate isomerase
MSLFVKICGLTTPEGVSAAIDAGASAVGFVFARSPRCVDIATACELGAQVPDDIVRVAVFHHPEASYWAEVVERFAPDWVQTDAEDFSRIELPSGCSALPVFRNGAVPRDADRHARLLFEGTVSGSGARADWAEARKLARRTHLVLAGGLDCSNVAEAIDTVAPWGLDVSSGVEARPGIKDPGKIREFIARAREMEKDQ